MPLSPEALEAAHLIDRLDRLARSDEQVGNLNPAQWEALRYLARANRFSRTPAAIAEYLASTRGTVSRTLASLEEKGYVARRADSEDGRSVNLALTRKAMDALKRDPLLTLAEDLEAGARGRMGDMAAGLKGALKAAIARNGTRAFDACFSCRHFRKDAHAGAAMPHHCGLLDAPLSDSDSRAICVEQEPMRA